MVGQLSESVLKHGPMHLCMCASQCSVGVTRGEVKAKSGAFRRKGYDRSFLAGRGALPARPCRNHTRARAESVQVVTRKIVIELDARVR